MKKCKCCKRELNESAFHKNKYSKDGLVLCCKRCIKKRDEKYWEQLTKDKIRYERYKERKRQYASDFWKNLKTDKKRHDEYCINRKQKDKKYYKNHKNHLKKIKRKYAKKYKQSEKGKIAARKCDARRNQGYKYIELFTNPFPDDIEVEYHHVNNILVVPIPKITHHYVGGRNIEEHRKYNALWLKKLFYFDVKKMLFDGFDGHDRIHAKC